MLRWVCTFRMMGHEYTVGLWATHQGALEARFGYLEGFTVLGVSDAVIDWKEQP